MATATIRITQPASAALTSSMIEETNPITSAGGFEAAQISNCSFAPAASAGPQGLDGTLGRATARRPPEALG